MTYLDDGWQQSLLKVKLMLHHSASIRIAATASPHKLNLRTCEERNRKIWLTRVETSTGNRHYYNIKFPSLRNGSSCSYKPFPAAAWRKLGADGRSSTWERKLSSFLLKESNVMFELRIFRGMQLNKHGSQIANDWSTVDMILAVAPERIGGTSQSRPRLSLYLVLILKRSSSRLGAIPIITLYTYITVYLSRRCSSEYKHSISSLSQYDEFLTVQILDVKFLCTDSSILMSPALVGDHSWLQYSRMGRTVAL